MSGTKRQTQNAKLAAAALILAATKGWQYVTLDAVAKESKIPLTALKKRFSAPHDLIPVIVDEMTREAIATAGIPPGPPRDVFFDLLMARFDVLQKHRKAILSITESARQDHALACTLARAGFKSMAAIVDAAKLDTSPRLVLTMGLSAVYAWAFVAWSKDKTRDMSKTMAALDRALRLAEKATEFLKERF